MPATPDHLARFVARLYRRLLVLRAAEGAALGLLGGAALALVLVPILLYRAQSAIGLILWLLPLSAIAGAAWVILRPPGTMAALLRADRQLGLSDLLSTAWLLAQSPDVDGDFARAVLCTAQCRAAGISPATIILRRLGRRCWGAVAVATALVLALAIISANPVDSQVQAAPRALALRGLPARAARQAASGGAASASGARRDAAPDLAADDPRSLTTSPPSRSDPARDPAGSNPGSNATDANGAGGGFATSPRNSIADWLPFLSAMRKRGQGPDAGGAGPPRTGASSANADPATVPPAPPWMMQGWNVARQAADAAIRDGRISATYRDVIRDYFDHQ